MALNQETVGLAFQISADAKPAQAEISAFKQIVNESLSAITQAFEKQGSDVQKSIAKQNKELGALAKQIDFVALGIAGAAAAFVGGLFLMAKSTSDLGSKIHDLSEATGVSTENLSALRVAADQSSSSLDQVSGGLKILDKNFAAAQAGSAKQIALFKQLGVDLSGDVNSALRQIVAKFGELPDGANKTALAMKVFGRSGADLIPTLNTLDGDLDKNIEKAREMGLVFSKEAADAADRFGDKVDELDKQLQGLKITIGNAVLPVFTTLISMTNTLITDTRKLFDLKFKGSAYEAFLKDIPTLLKGGFAVNTAAYFAGAAGETQPGKKVGKIDPPDPTGKTKRDEASQQALKRLRDQFAEEERIFKDAEKELKRGYDQRGIDEEEFSKAQIANAQKRLDAEIAILDKEKATIEASRFSKEQKQTQLEEVAIKRTDLERKTSDELEKIDDDSRKRRQEQGIQLEQERLRRAEAFFAAQRAAIEAAAARNDITQEAAERQLTEIVQQGIEERLALANAEVARSGENSALRAIANEKVKALEIDLASAIEQSKQRIADAQKRDLQNLRAYIDARNQLLILQREQEVAELDQRASQLEKKSGLGPVSNAIAQRARQEALVAEENFLNQQNQARIQADQLAAESAAQTQAQKLAVMQAGNQALENEERRHTAALGQISETIASPISQIRDVLSGAAQAFAETAIAAIASAQSIGAAMKALAAGVLKQIASIAIVEAAKNVAYALEALGIISLTGNPSAGVAAGHFFAAAAAWGALGLGAALGAGALSKGGSSGGAGAGAGNSVNTSDGGPRVINQGDRTRPAPQVIIIRAETEPGVVVNRVIQDYRSNGVTRQVLRGDMLGQQ